MIIKSFEINKINTNKHSFILLYGKNEGLKNQTRINLLKNKNITFNYEENEIINNPDFFLKALIQNPYLKMKKL